MINAKVTSSKIKDVGPKTNRGIRKAMKDAADAGFAVSFDESPDGATSNYRLSWVEPQWVGNTLVWGNRAPYARAIEKGLPAGHWIPVSAIPEVALWASRVLGADDPEASAWGVRQKIGTEGTEGQHVLEQGYIEMLERLEREGFGDSIRAEYDLG